MGGNPLAERIGSLLRDPSLRPSEVEIEFDHRGAEGDIDRITGDALRWAGPSGLELDDGRAVPLHRVRAVRIGGREVYRRRGGAGAGSRSP